MRVLAVDPGRVKCGLAIVDTHDGVLARGIVATDVVALVAEKWVAQHRPTLLVVGKGTSLRELRARLERVGLPLVIQPEENTTLLARDRYYEENPPRGWQRLVPRGLLTPPVPVDDYAAVLIAESFLARAPEPVYAPRVQETAVGE